MKSEYKLKILRLLFIISLIITIFFINTTYAKYYEQLKTNYELAGIKRWKVKINNIDIYEEKNLNEILQPYIIENENAKENILVPGSEGYFEIEIDYTEVDLVFTANFTIEQITEPMLQDFELYGYTVRNKNDEITDDQELEMKNITVKKSNGKVGPMTLTEEFDPTTEQKEDKIKIIRAHFRWNDETGIMNNQKDTDYRGKEVVAQESTENNNTLIEYNANLTVMQKI